MSDAVHQATAILLPSASVAVFSRDAETLRAKIAEAKATD